MRSQSLPILEAIRSDETMRKVAAATEDAAEGRSAAEHREPRLVGAVSGTGTRRRATRSVGPLEPHGDVFPPGKSRSR